MSRRQNITTVSATAASVLAERSIHLAEPAPAARPAIVYLADDPAAEARARDLWRASGGALVPVRTADAYPRSVKAREARMGWEAAYGTCAPLVEKHAEAAVVAAADAVTVVATLVGARLAAPLAAFLSAHDLSGKQLTVDVPVPAEAVSPAFYRDIAERLPRGAAFALTASGACGPKAFVAGGKTDGFARAAAQACAAMAERRAARRAA